MTSGSSADTTMTIGGGEIALPAAVAVSVDSIATEEDKAKPSASSPSSPTRKARSSPRTTTTSPPSSPNPRTRATERRPFKTVVQRLQSTLKVRDREPRSPEQKRTRSSRSSSEVCAIWIC